VSKLTHVQENALKQIVGAGGRVMVSRRRGNDRMAHVQRAANSPQRVALPSVDAFVRRGLLALDKATQTGDTVFELWVLTEAGRALAVRSQAPTHRGGLTDAHD